MLIFGESVLCSQVLGYYFLENSTMSENSWFSRMKVGWSKSSKNLTDGLMNVLVGGKEIDDELLEEVEDQLWWRTLVSMPQIALLPI